MNLGTRVIVLPHKALMPKDLWGYEGTITDIIRDASRPVYEVKMPWAVKPFHCVADILCPVYNNCEVCNYAAWSNVNTGTEKKPEWHHFCAWHIKEAMGANTISIA